MPLMIDIMNMSQFHLVSHEDHFIVSLKVYMNNMLQCH